MPKDTKDTSLDLAHLERLLATVMRPGDVWQYGCGGGYGIVAYDGDDIRCQIAIADAGDGYDYGQSPAADLAIAAVNALPELIAAARERDGWQRAAESQNRQWSQKCEALTEERARREELATQLLATQQDRHRILMERDKLEAVVLRLRLSLNDATTECREAEAERDALRDEVERMRAVVEAAEAFASHFDADDASQYGARRSFTAFYAALDAAKEAGR